MGIDMSPAEAAEVIDRFLQGTGAPYAWDDFTSVRCTDPVVEAARLRCVSVRDEHPSERPGEYCSAPGLSVLRDLATSLRQCAA